MLKRIGSAFALAALISASLVALGTTPAHAARADLSVSSLAWWWEDATREEREVPNVGTITIETPNPFCPSAGGGTGSPSQVCSEGRLPIEVRNGDYETQNKISAVAFDMTLIPVGSEINKFTVTFREAKEGCYDRNEPDQDPSDDTCEETSPQNVGDHQLQACVVEAYFGDGEARPYKEVPTYNCTSADPKATRKEVKSDKDGPGSNFYWTFDLTDYASNWTSKFSAVTGIMIVGVPVKEQGENDSDTWRVVLTGPRFQNGVKAVIDYIPAETDIPLPPTDPGIGTDPGAGTTGSTGTFGSTGTTDSGTTDGGSLGGGAGAPTPGASPSPALAIEEPQPVEELPAYMWLAILAGIIGFSLVRQIVIERTTGIRPDGVLATIHRINQESGSRAAAAAAASGGPLSALGSGFKAVGHTLGPVFGKLNFWKKG